MIAGWCIDESMPFGLIGKTGHVHDKKTVVDAVFPFIHKYPGHARTWILNISHASIRYPTVFVPWIPWPTVAPSGATYPVVDGHAADAGDTFVLAIDTIRFVTRAFPDGDGFAAVRPKRALTRVTVVIPIVRVS